MKRYGKQQGQVLIILVTTLFLAGTVGGGGSGNWNGRFATGMTLDTIRERIDEAVLDPDRKVALADLLDQWGAEGDAYLERIQERRLKLLDVLKEHDTNPDELGKFMVEIDEKNDAADSRILDIRFALGEEMSRNEWEAVFKAE